MNQLFGSVNRSRAGAVWPFRQVQVILDSVWRALPSDLFLGLAACVLGACGGQSFAEEGFASTEGTGGASAVAGTGGESPVAGAGTGGSLSIGIPSNAGSSGNATGGTTQDCPPEAQPRACLPDDCRPPPEGTSPACVDGTWTCAGGRPISECPAGTCPDTHATCCNPLTGDSAPATCIPPTLDRTCASGWVMLWDAACEVAPDFSCPAGPADMVGAACAIFGAVCEYAVGCGGDMSCRCEVGAPGVPPGAYGWVCESAAGANCAK